MWSRRRAPSEASGRASIFGSTRQFGRMLGGIRNAGRSGDGASGCHHVSRSSLLFCVSLLLFPLVGLAFFPQTDAGQFVVNLKAPSGTKLTDTEKEVARVEAMIREIVAPEDMGMIVSNIGVDPGFSSVYSSNSAMHTAVVQASLKPGHRIGSYEYIARVKQRMQDEMPELAAFFSSGSLVDAVVNMGMPAPIDLQVSGRNLQDDYKTALTIASRIRQLRGRCRRLHSAGSGLSGVAAQYRSHARGRTGPERKRSDVERHHGPDFEPDGGAEYLGRSEERQQLLADRSISGTADPGGQRSACDSAARRERAAARRASIWSAESLRFRRRRKWITTRSAAGSTSMSGRSAKHWDALPNRSTGSLRV